MLADKPRIQSGFIGASVCWRTVQLTSVDMIGSVSYILTRYRVSGVRTLQFIRNLDQLCIREWYYQLLWGNVSVAGHKPRISRPETATVGISKLSGSNLLAEARFRDKGCRASENGHIRFVLSYFTEILSKNTGR